MGVLYEGVSSLVGGQLIKSGPVFLGGNAGEEYLLNRLGGGIRQGFKTSQGWRWIDTFYEGIAHESKVGFTRLTSFVQKQVLKDVELREAGIIGKAVWHFYRSAITGKIGPSPQLKQFLKDNGIKYIIHRWF